MRKSIILLASLALTLLPLASLRAATPAQIATSIDNGIQWLASQQIGTGEWPHYEPVATTAFALVKLEERAFELGYNSPFDDAYPYKENVVKGLDYLFTRAGTYGLGTGKCFAKGGHETYSTGLAMMAIAATRAPGRVVTTGPFAGSSYKQILDDCVAFFVWSQNPDGGWRYWANNQPSDNSNSGYAVLGLRYAEAPVYGFACNVAPVRPGLNNWINAIQNPVTGASDYTIGGAWPNLLKTGNLLCEMSLFGDSALVPRVQNAVAYIQNTWNANNSDPGWRPHHYQSMYCLMKGLESMGLNTLTVGGNPVNWYDEFADTIVNSQNFDGSWPGDNWGDTLLSTEWALLVLEKVAPPPPVNLTLKLSAEACDSSGYVVEIKFTVERFTVDGTLNVLEDGTLVYTEVLSGFTGDAVRSLLVASDTPGAHTWKATLDVTPQGGGTAAHAEAQGIITVCETPQVAGIPDQTAPFQTFDLDNYLSYSGGLPVAWASIVPVGWTCAIDGENVATITAPVGAGDPSSIVFIATVATAQGTICSGSQSVLFTPNNPPDCTKAFSSLGSLWPPNNKMIPVQILGVTDPDGDPITINVDRIFQDESVDTFGDGKFTPDGTGVGTEVAWLRAERSGTAKVPGDGRVYHIYFTANDGRGGTCSGEVLVGVPHDEKDTPVDGGPLFDSTALKP